MEAKKRHGKSIAREEAMKSLYNYAVTNSKTGMKSGDKLASEMTENTIAHIEEIDAVIVKHLRKWSISELNQVNLSILRIAVYELTYEDTPANIVINEAIEMTKKYSDIKSKNFIHGVLDNIAKGR